MNRPKDIRKSVSKSYALAVEKSAGGTRACCPGPTPQGVLAVLAGYGREELAALPADAVANSFGCGNPVALAEIREGETVLDLGSGAGIDLLLAAKIAGPAGRVIGVDMTPAMIDRAKANAEAAGLANVEVREGIIEDVPVEGGSVDLVISNCVINLSPEKRKVFAELHRILRPGGRFSISDIVAKRIPAWVKELSPLYSSCITGAVSEGRYLAGLRKAGFVGVAVRDRLIYDAAQLLALLDSETAGSCCCGSETLSRTQAARVVAALGGKVASVRIVGRKRR